MHDSNNRQGKIMTITKHVEFTIPNPVHEKQYIINGDLYYCPECDHILTVRDGRIIDSSCKHAYLNYIPVGPKQFIQMITDRPHVLREGYIEG